ncbi:MAG TPA: GNAT family N-acetyltransferase [Gemmatimonadaceae bacterium]|nr:GNAT family N-acetyltransferase [Gemmatimonadaceae bacterium]
MARVLETERLTLRELEPADAPFIFTLVNQPSWLEYIGDRHVHSLDDARAYIASGPAASYAKNGFGLWLVSLRDGDVPAGMCGLLRRDTLEHPDIGFAFLPEFWSQGYAAEAAQGTLRYARDTLGLGPILAITSLHNDRSIRLLAKLGFRFDRVQPSEKGGDVNVYVSDPRSS